MRSLKFVDYQVISNIRIKSHEAPYLSSIILEGLVGDNLGGYFFINDDYDKIYDVLNMPIYIKNDWIKYNIKKLDLPTLNNHIKYYELVEENDNILKIKSILYSIRRNLIIEGII
jgi:hypothetical protein